MNKNKEAKIGNIKIIAIIAVSLMVFTIISFKTITSVIAETSGSSPESTTTSRIKTLSDSLTTLGFGSTNSGSWGDWGGMWNRIYSASTWTPSGATAGVGDVTSGKTFYINSRVIQTGAGVLQPTPTPGSPSVGDDSRINTLYKQLVTLNYGSDSAGSWGDWGAMWNRIYSASIWTPSDATALPGDVSVGNTFYAGNNRTIQTSSVAYPEVFVNQSLCLKENTGAPCTAVQAVPVPATTWTNTANNVWKDNRTGLYWSEDKGSMTNSFLTSCGFFTTNPRGNWSGTTCGDAINFCSNLAQVAVSGQSEKTNWYLPSYKELLQAYKDDMFNKTGTAFTTENIFWSSTEVSYQGVYGWVVPLSYDASWYNVPKYNTNSVRCVARD